MRTKILPQRLLQVVAVTVMAIALWCGLTVTAEAKSFTYPHYDVDISINADSTVDVTETLTYRFLGTFRGVIRQITLENRSLSLYCINSGLTCGGFDQLSLLGVYDEQDQLIDPGLYEIGTVTDEDEDARYFEIKWEVWPGERTFDGDETFTWKIKYRLYGSIGFIGEGDDVDPYLYWNALPANRGGNVEATKITINLPSGYRPAEQFLEVFTDYSTSIDVATRANTLTITAENIGSSGNFTVSYKLPRGSINVPAELNYFGWLPMFGTGVKIDGIDLGDAGGQVRGFPAGEHTVEFSFPGYQAKQVEVSVAPAEVFHMDSTLTPGPIMLILLLCNFAANFFGLILIPLAFVYVYIRWRSHGRDFNMPPTIIPLFHPPKGVRPYLLGSLKDEKVDREDVTGTIIDLAYRGYLKIKELEKGKNYELTRLEGKPKDPGLNKIESQLLDDMFDGDTVKETKDMGTHFAMRYPHLQGKIYNEMVERGYFTEAPQTTRGKHLGCGLGLTALGIGGLGVSVVLGLAIMGVPGPLFLGLALLVLGICMAVASSYMPAKTSEGSKVLAEILGFRMYMYHAERYRVQGLSPDEFEKFLSYAIVFGLEKEWAKKFEDIYKGQPDWYDGPGGLYDAYWYSSFSRSFANSLNSTVYQPLSTGSASGGGWSGGGGSFGGFSGGGGGGGSSGAF